MKTSALLFATALFSAVSCASAYDSDPGYGPDRPWLEGQRRGDRWYGRDDDAGSNADRMWQPRYYRPTMRYYGNGYTVSYRYMPVFWTDTPRNGSVGVSTNFRTEEFHLTPAQIKDFGANQPRLTLKDERSAAPRTAVTSIDRKKTTKRTSTKGAAQDGPAIRSSPLPATDGAAPAPSPAAAPDASAPPAPPKP